MLTPKQIRTDIDTIDRRLTELSEWETRLVEARNRYVLASDQEVVALIDDGKRPGEGRPNDPALEPFDRRMPGLRQTRVELGQLRERRALLASQLPSDASRAALDRELQDKAVALAVSIEALSSRAGRLNDLLEEAGSIAVSIAESARVLWEARAQVVHAADTADIRIPAIPDVEVPKVPTAMTLGALLQRHFACAEPYAVEPFFQALRSGD